jgi:hypothetical protein
MDDDGDGDGATDDYDDDDNDGDNSNGTAADDDVDVDNNDVDDVDVHNLPPCIGKRNDGCNEPKTRRRRRSQILWEYTQQSNRSHGGGCWGLYAGHDFHVWYRMVDVRTVA